MIRIAGWGKTRFGVLDATLEDMAHEAAAAALDVAGITLAEVDAVVVANFLGHAAGQLHLGPLLAPGIPSWRVEAACASGGVAVHQAVAMNRVYPTVLVVGVEKMTGIEDVAGAIALAADTARDGGRTFPELYAACAEAAYSEGFVTPDDLAAVAVKNHTYALDNPHAHFHKPITLADVDASPVIASPIRRLDACPVSDGAAAVVVSSVLDGVPVAASTLATDTLSPTRRDSLTRFAATETAGMAAYDAAGITPDEVTAAEVHDCFTIAERMAVRDLGLHPHTVVNRSGGLKAGGHPIGATGVSQIAELASRYDGAYMLAHNVGGVGGTAVVHILGAP